MIRRLVILLAAIGLFGLPAHAQAPGSQYGRINTARWANLITGTLTGATPSVANGNTFITGNSGTTTITNFLNGVDSQQISVTCGDTNTTIQNGTFIVTASGSNIGCASKLTIGFVYIGSLGQWIQTSGSSSGGGGAFGSLTGGTNTTATMHVGTGASLDATGSGSIHATQVPWAGLSSTPSDCPGGQAIQGYGNGTTWNCTSVSGSPGGSGTQLQYRSSGAFAGLPGNGYNASAGTVDIGVDAIFPGPNPYIDIRDFGAVAVLPGSAPAIPGVTANCTNTSTTVSVSSAAFGNGNGLALWGCGPATANTPSAPTLAVVLAASQTGTGSVVAAPAGSTTYCYQLLSRTIMGGTSPSTETCTATGPATLGLQTNTITSVSLSNNVATYLTSAPHGLAVGAFIVIGGVSTTEYTHGSSPAFNGLFTVATVPDNTHFTVNLTSDTRNGAFPSGTGGTVSYWNAIRVTATETTNNYQYYIYGRVTGGTKTLIGQMLPQNHSLITQPFYLEWEDFGGISTFPTKPAYIPSTVPASGTNDMLATTVVSGGGTTTLVVANAASANTTGSTVLIDDAQAFVAASTVALTAGTTGNIRIPSTGDASKDFVFNTPITVSSGTSLLAVDQVGQIYVNEPIQFGAHVVKWAGNPTPSAGANPGFSQQAQVGIFCNNASPCMYAKTNTFVSGVTFRELAQNGAVMFLQDTGGIPTSTFKDISWTGYTGGNSFTNISGVFRGHSGADMQFVNNTITSSQNGSIASMTPGLFFNEMSNLKFDYVYMSGVGVAIYPNTQGAGSYLHANEVYCQACYMPNFSITNAIGPVYAHIDNVIFDTATIGASLANYAGAKVSFTGSFAGTVYGIGQGSSGGSIGPQLTNQDVTATTIVSGGTFTLPGDTATFTHNQPVAANDGTFPHINIGMDFLNRSTAMGQGYSLFTDTATPAAPTCSLAAGGSFVVATTYYFYYAPIMIGNASEGRASQWCSVTPTSGNQTVTLSVPSAPNGATGTYTWYQGTGSPNGSNANCGTYGAAPSFSDPTICTNAGLGSGPVNPSGGPAGIRGKNLWAENLILGTAVTTPTGGPNQLNIYLDNSSLWPTFKVNSNSTTYPIPSYTGGWTNGYCAVATATTNVFSLSPCSASGSVWANLTSGTNSQTGTFAVTGNSWDFSGATIFKARNSGGLTTSAIGDFGYDTTNKNWHAFQNGVDSFMFTSPVSGTFTDGDCVKISKSSNIITLVDSLVTACGWLGTTLGDTMYGGASGVPTRLAGPTTSGITFYLCDTPSGGLAQAEQWCTSGVPLDAQSGTTPYTIPSSDNIHLITQNNASASAMTGPTLAGNPTFALFNIGAGALTYTPASGTVNGNATQVFGTKWFGFHYTDNSNTFMPVMPTDGAFPDCHTAASALLFTASTKSFTCNTISGSGTVNTASLGQFAGYLANGTAVSGVTPTGDFTCNTSFVCTVGAAAITPAKLTTAANTFTASVTDLAPVVGDSGLILAIDPAQAIHLTRVYGSVQGATNVVLNLDERTEAAPGTDTGNHLLGSDLTAVVGGANTSTFANGAGQCGGTGSCAISVHHPVYVTFTSVSGTPTVLSISIEYTKD